LQQCEGKHGAVILDDCYNANPVSMQSAIDTLRSLKGGKNVILADMAELGADSEAAHAALNLDGIDKIWLIGTRMQVLAARYPGARWFATTDEACSTLADERFTAGDTVLVKGSRSMALELIVQLLCKQEVIDAL